MSVFTPAVFRKLYYQWLPHNVAEMWRCAILL